MAVGRFCHFSHGGGQVYRLNLPFSPTPLSEEYFVFLQIFLCAFSLGSSRCFNFCSFCFASYCFLAVTKLSTIPCTVSVVAFPFVFPSLCAFFKSLFTIAQLFLYLHFRFSQLCFHQAPLLQFTLHANSLHGFLCCNSNDAYAVSLSRARDLRVCMYRRVLDGDDNNDDARCTMEMHESTTLIIIVPIHTWADKRTNDTAEKTKNDSDTPCKASFNVCTYIYGSTVRTMYEMRACICLYVWVNDWVSEWMCLPCVICVLCACNNIG